MTAQNLTSVILVTYHTGPVLDVVLDAVLAQTADIELILINNGNPPEVEARLINRFKDDPCVRLMTGHGNIGLSRGNNLGVRVASGGHVLLLSPRCVLQPDTVALLLAQAATVTPPYLLGARLVDRGGHELPGSRSALLSPSSAAVEALRLYSYFPHHRLRLHEEPVPAKMAPVPAISAAFMFMRKKDYLQAKGFLEAYVNYIADMDFCFRFSLAGGGIYFVPQIKALMAAKDTSSNRAEIEHEKARGLILYFHENFSDKYFQPFLWVLYGVLWLRGQIKAALSAVI